MTALVCNECPWRRAACPGWLGPLRAQQWIEVAHSDERIACHLSIPEGAIEGDWDLDELEHCGGAAIYRANVAKISRDPRCPRERPDRDRIFGTPQEFLGHHERHERPVVPLLSNGLALPQGRALAELVQPGTARVRLTWRCGATQTKDYSRGPRPKQVGPSGVAILVRTWRSTGVSAPCPKHGPRCP